MYPQLLFSYIVKFNVLILALFSTYNFDVISSLQVADAPHVPHHVPLGQTVVAAGVALVLLLFVVHDLDVAAEVARVGERPCAPKQEGLIRISVIFSLFCKYLA